MEVVRVLKRARNTKKSETKAEAPTLVPRGAFLPVHEGYSVLPSENIPLLRRRKKELAKELGRKQGLLGEFDTAQTRTADAKKALLDLDKRVWSEVKHTLGKRPLKTTLVILQAVHLILVGSETDTKGLRKFFGGKGLQQALTRFRPSLVIRNRLALKSFVEENIASFNEANVRHAFKALVGLRQFVERSMDVAEISDKVHSWDFTRGRVQAIKLELAHVETKLAKWETVERLSLLEELRNKPKKLNHIHRPSLEETEPLLPSKAACQAASVAVAVSSQQLPVQNQEQAEGSYSSEQSVSPASPRRVSEPAVSPRKALAGRVRVASADEHLVQPANRTLLPLPPAKRAKAPAKPSPTPAPREHSILDRPPSSIPDVEDREKLVGRLKIPNFEPITARRISYGLSQLDYSVKNRLNKLGMEDRKAGIKLLFQNYPKKILMKDAKEWASQEEEYDVDEIVEMLSAKRRISLTTKTQIELLYNFYLEAKTKQLRIQV